MPDENDKKNRLSSGSGDGPLPVQEEVNGRSSETQEVYIRELKKVNEELRQARRAALNLMEDAILSKEALRQSEEKYRTKLEQEVRDRTAELKVSKELLQATMNASMDMIQVFEAVRNEHNEIVDFRYVLLNHEAERWMPKNTIGSRLLQLQPGVKEEGIFEVFKQVVETGIPDQRERRYVHEQFNGWFYQSVVKLGDGVATTTTNITGRKTAELEVQQSRTMLQTVIDAPNIGMAVYKTVRNQNGEIIDFVHEYINRASLQMLGGEDFTGRLLTDHGENAIVQLPQLIQVVESGKANSYIREADFRGKKVWFAITNTPLDGERLVHTWQDVTERKKAEAEILRLKDEVAQKATDKYQALFNSIDEGFTIIELLYDNEGKPVDFLYQETNPALLKHVGMNVQGKRRSELFLDKKDFLLEKYEHLAKTGEPLHFEYSIDGLGGQWFQVTAARIGREGSKHLGVLFRNITERKQREQQQAFLLHFSDALRTLNNKETIESTSLRLISEFLGLDHSYITEVHTQLNRGVIPAEYNPSGLLSLIGEYRMSDFPESVRQLQGKTLVIENVAGDPTLSDLDKASLAAVKVAAFVSATIRKGEQNAIWIFVPANSTPRTWTKEEVELIEIVAERTWAAIEKAKAEEALRESEEKYRTLFNSMDEGVSTLELIFDENERVVDYIFVEHNAAMTQQTGLSGDTIGKRVSEFTPGLEAYWLETFERVIKTGVPERHEYYIAALNGWFDIYTTRVSVSNNRRVVSIYNNVTERKEAEEALRKSEEKYRTLFETIEEGFCIMELVRDDKGDVVDVIFREVNKAFERHTGLTNVIGKRSTEIIPNQTPDRFKFYQRLSETGETTLDEVYITDANRWLRLYRMRLGGPGSNLLAAIFEDVTERKQREQHQQFLLNLSDKLGVVDSLKDVHTTVTDSLLEHYDAGWCYYVEWDEEKNSGVVQYDSRRDDLLSLAGTHDVSDIPGFLDFLKSGQILNVSDYENYELLTPTIRERYTAAGFRSMLVASLVRQGKLISSLIIGDTKIRNWSRYDEALLAEVAERTWAAVERARAEEALRKSEAKFRRLSDSGLVSVAFFDMEGAITEANDAFLNMLGLTKDELKSNKVRWDVYTPKEWMPRTLEAVEEFKQTGYISPYEKQFYHSSGELRWGIFAGATLEDGQTGVSLVIDITERRKAEEALRKSEARLAKELEDTKQIQQFSNKVIHPDNEDDIYETLLDTAMKLMQSDFASVQLYSPETETLSLIAHKNFHPDSAAFWQTVSAASGSVCGEALQNKSRVLVNDIETSAFAKNELEIFRLSGIRAVQSTPIISRNGTLMGILNTQWKEPRKFSDQDFYLFDVIVRQAADLMERRQVEEALLQSEERLRTLADAVPQVIWANDAKGMANYFNQRWYEYSGLNYEQSVGLGWEAIVHPDDAPPSNDKWQKALAAGEIFDTEYRLRRHDGQYRWHIGRNVPLRDEAGKVTGWFGSATDIEDLKQTTEALSQSEARLKITMESATDYGIITMDTERRIERWSKGATQLFGYTEAEMLGQPADIIFTEEDKKAGAPQKEMEMARDTGRAADERWHQRKDGSRFYVSGVMRPIQNHELTGYVKVMRDMTQQQLFTEELHRLVAERTAELQRSNEDLRQFAHVASHDLKEPVRKIQTFNNRILDEYADALPPRVKAFSEKIGTSADRMISMIEGVLRYSKLGNAEQTWMSVNLNETIRQIIIDLEVLIQQKQAEITAAELPTLNANPTLMYQLFYNLVLNALKFSKEDEPPRISFSFERVKEQQKSLAHITVADNGIGFEAEFNEEIFRTFTRLHPAEDYEGTGLGLALCKKIVERHGGTIAASGEPGVGAVFTILLPL